MDQKMRLTKGLETSSSVTVPFTAEKPRNLQHYMDGGGRLKSSHYTDYETSAPTIRQYVMKISRATLNKPGKTRSLAVRDDNSFRRRCNVTDWSGVATGVQKRQARTGALRRKRDPPVSELGETKLLQRCNYYTVE
jgi:hypothetical protein